MSQLPVGYSLCSHGNATSTHSSMTSRSQLPVGYSLCSHTRWTPSPSSARRDRVSIACRLQPLFPPEAEAVVDAQIKTSQLPVGYSLCSHLTSFIDDAKSGAVSQLPVGYSLCSHSTMREISGDGARLRLNCLSATAFVPTAMASDRGPWLKLSSQLPVGYSLCSHLRGHSCSAATGAPVSIACRLQPLFPPEVIALTLRVKL